MLIFIIFLFHNVFLSNNQHINGPTISNPNCLVILHVDMNNPDELLNLETPLKFIYSEKATKFCEIFVLLLSYVSEIYIV